MDSKGSKKQDELATRIVALLEKHSGNIVSDNFLAKQLNVKLKYLRNTMTGLVKRGAVLRPEQCFYRLPRKPEVAPVAVRVPVVTSASGTPSLPPFGAVRIAEALGIVPSADAKRTVQVCLGKIAKLNETKAEAAYVRSKLRGTQGALKTAQNGLRTANEIVNVVCDTLGISRKASPETIAKLLKGRVEDLRSATAEHSAVTAALGLPLATPSEVITATIKEVVKKATSATSFHETLCVLLHAHSPDHFATMLEEVKKLVEKDSARAAEIEDLTELRLLREEAAYVRAHFALQGDAPTADVVDAVDGLSRELHHWQGIARSNASHADDELREHNQTREEMARVTSRLKALSAASMKLAALSSLLGKESEKLLFNFTS